MEILSSQAYWVFFFRWLHILSGIMWIGHLWYFNFTQAPTVPKIPMELRPAITKFILPEALFWFRWSAFATWVTGLIVGGLSGWLVPAIMLGVGSGSQHVTAIGIGMWLGTIMLFNVWIIIWPNQRKVIGLVQADDAGKKAAARRASLASRVNTLLSIPMLYCMAANHFYT
ncbi:MAG TPA: urate hydroxylase PuuD [Stellaceae bacterium]|nr:urate hydroxylase PuuD [Stellaceae bacterium]